MGEHIEPVRQAFTEAQLLELFSAHQWLFGYMAAQKVEVPMFVQKAVGNFTPPNLRYEKP